MLNELTGLQTSDEQVWGSPKISFEVETRSTAGDELLQRTYVFSYTPEWDKWMFSEFEEKCATSSSEVGGRNWRRRRHIYWNDAESPSVDVPPEVTERLEELLGLEQVVLQKS
jgi:hypothetical protein